MLNQVIYLLCNLVTLSSAPQPQSPSHSLGNASEPWHINLPRSKPSTRKGGGVGGVIYEEEEPVGRVCAGDALLQAGVLDALVHVQQRWESNADLTALLVSFLTRVAQLPAPCNSAFSRAAPSPSSSSASASFSTFTAPALRAAPPTGQRPNYFVADDIRRSGIHDSILSAVRRYQHPLALMQAVAALHELVAQPMWGQRVLTRDAKQKIHRKFGYASSSAATYMRRRVPWSLEGPPDGREHRGRGRGGRGKSLVQLRPETKLDREILTRHT